MWIVFLITFCAVVTVGMAGLLVLHASSRKAPRGDEPAPSPAQGSEQGLGDSGFFAERIPGREEAGSTQTGEDAGGTKAEENAQTEPQGRYGEQLADEAYLKENRILPWESADEETVTFGFVGDILLDDEYAIMASLLSRGASIENGISEATLAKMREADIMVINNEFPFTDRGTPTEGKTFTFRADTAAVSYLHDMGADVAILANNHIYDFGEVGLLDTLDTLENAQIPGVGAGRNLEEASAPLYFIVNDIKIALVAATQIERLENPDTRGATQDSAGVFRCLNPAKLYEVVKEAKQNSDFVIVYIHWGTEFQEQPDWAQAEQAPGLAQAGADLIIGDHPHILQGIDYIGDTLVIYSLGNFWFNSRSQDTGMVQATIGPDGLTSFRFLPALQSGCRVALAEGEEKERILAHMRELSPNVSIDGDGFVTRP